YERKRAEPLHQSTYPNTRFWTPTLYETWKKSPEAQYTEHGPFSFLENADGKPVEKSEISRITKSLRSCWAALKQENRAPDTWGKAGNKILDEVAEEMARLHPILALCENGWKVHAIATERYPSWTATHLDKKKRKVHNTEFGDHNTSKRQKVSGSAEPESDASKSGITGDESISTLRESKVKKATPSKDITTATSETSEQVQQVNDTQQPQSISHQDGLDHSNDNINTSTRITEDTETPVEGMFATMASFPAIKNPLAKFAGRKRESAVPDPVVTPPNVPAPLSTPAPPSNDMPAPPASATVESASVKKFRPGTSKNGRSLCAHRWLRQVDPNGSSANFRIYWSGLMKEKQLAYETDALKLVKEDIWNGNTVDIISKISSGTLY
ncbi:hypothetical protein P692DRAFT_20882127, partial [Suillus brevipes Sb2]